MKNLKIYTLLTFLALLMMASCKKDDDNDAELTAQQQVTSELSDTWGDAEVLDAPGNYATLEDLEITFTATSDFQPSSFSASGADDYFLSNTNSTWAWNGDNATQVQLMNVSPVQFLAINELTGTSLTISFTYDGPEGGRVMGIGTYQVRLTRQ